MRQLVFPITSRACFATAGRLHVEADNHIPAMTALLNHLELEMQSRIMGGGHAPASFHDVIIPLLDQTYSFARFLSRDADGAQEIAEDALLRAHGDYDRYCGGDNRAWLFRIVRNCYHDWLTARRRTARRFDHADSGRRVLQELRLGEDLPEVGPQTFRLAIEQMPRPLREMIILREVEQLSYRQIAAVTSLPISTIMTRLARARRRLRNGRRDDAAAVSAGVVADPEAAPVLAGNLPST